MKCAVIWTVVILAGAMCLAGCLKKKIDVTFTNLTDDRLDVYLSGPGEGTGVVGTLNGKNDRVHTRIELSPDQLPAQYSWSAGQNCSGRFTVRNERKIQPRFVDVGATKTRSEN